MEQLVRKWSGFKAFHHIRKNTWTENRVLCPATRSGLHSHNLLTQHCFHHRWWWRGVGLWWSEAMPFFEYRKLCTNKYRARCKYTQSAPKLHALPVAYYCPKMWHTVSVPFVEWGHTGGVKLYRLYRIIYVSSRTTVATRDLTIKYAEGDEPG